ncbi:ribbon-helix-helix DNA binding domain protein [Microbacterium phage Fizzles]|nr:ribbon-helix-helix DNA binding domain protein [Microbacterium phage Fizzles]
MGQRPLDGAPKDKQVNLRLNEEEHEMLLRKRTRRGLGQSQYFRQLMKEDPE